MRHLSGGCACGAVRYSIEAAPIFSFHCHCRQCQRAAGAGHASLFSVARASMTISGELTFYTQTAADGATVRRGFCPVCGSPVLGSSSGHPDLLLVTAASLDDPAQFKPQRHIFTAERQPWDYRDPALPGDEE